MKQRPVTQFGRLAVGPVPRVVGTISGAAALTDLAGHSAGGCDLVEIRLDQIGVVTTDWLGAGCAIEAQGLPVIVTVRLANEGGAWTRPDQQRAEIFQTALAHLAAIDIEQRSPLLPSLAAAARAAGKGVIVSFHDFQKTPGLPQLREVVAAAAAQGSVAKVATMINRPEDVTTLRDLLGQDWPVPLAVMGMGPAGAGTRPLFARLGSCLAYGYLDQPAAPGQPSAAALVSQLRQPPDR